MLLYDDADSILKGKENFSIYRKQIYRPTRIEQLRAMEKHRVLEKPKVEKPRVFEKPKVEKPRVFEKPKVEKPIVVKHGIWKVVFTSNKSKVYYDFKKINLTELKIYVDLKRSFTIKPNDFTLHYRMTRTLNDMYDMSQDEQDIVIRWRDGDKMTFWQNQLNFAMYCATTACGLSKEHLENGKPIQKSIMYFHVYYTVRRIIFEIEARLPTDDGFDDRDNPYNKKAYEKICNEFNLDITPFKYINNNDKDWGLGTWWVNLYGTAKENGLEYWWQKSSIEGRWSIFIIDETYGFTKPGAVRINESIRNYVYCILGAQVQTRSQIIGNSGSALDAQKQFNYLLDKSISQPFSLESSIANYQNACESASSLIDYNVGVGLYMVPSNMNLSKLAKKYANFNDMIVVASDQMVLGKQPDLDPIVKQTTPRVTNTGELVAPKQNVVPSGVTVPVFTNADIQKSADTQKPEDVTPNEADIQKDKMNHDEQKLALTLGIVGLSTLLYWYVKM